jgi:hypothetical protein
MPKQMGQLLFIEIIGVAPLRGSFLVQQFLFGPVPEFIGPAFGLSQLLPQLISPLADLFISGICHRISPLNFVRHVSGGIVLVPQLFFGLKIELPVSAFRLPCLLPKFVGATDDIHLSWIGHFH